MEAKGYRLSKKRQAEQMTRRAQSRYGQIRLTVTFTPTGRAYFRAMAKRPQDDWKEMHVFDTGYDDFAEYPPDFAAALMHFAAVAENLRWRDNAHQV